MLPTLLTSNLPCRLQPLYTTTSLYRQGLWFQWYVRGIDLTSSSWLKLGRQSTCTLPASTFTNSHLTSRARAFPKPSFWFQIDPCISFCTCTFHLWHRIPNLQKVFRYLVCFLLQSSKKLPESQYFGLVPPSESLESLELFSLLLLTATSAAFATFAALYFEVYRTSVFS